MAAVNRNMFDASITTDRPGGVSLMKLPLNLIVQIVSNVSLFLSSPKKQLIAVPRGRINGKD